MSFTVENTNQAKGLAIILLLIHHLFYQPAGYFQDIVVFDVPLVFGLARFSKVAVGIFVLLSGFGLYKSFEKKNAGFKNFCVQHLIKIYLNYWLMWILFVPIGFLFFGRTLQNIYGHSEIFKLLINISGLQYAFNFYGINPTWWFMSCIVILYLLFPFLYTLLKRFKEVFLILIFVISLLSIDISILGVQPFEPIREYLFTFVLGMFIAQRNSIEKINATNYKMLKLLLLTVVFLIFIFLRFQLKSKSLIVTDGVISFILIYLLSQLKAKLKLLTLLGEHSFNIFLFHTFIYYFYFHKIVYVSSNPIVIFSITISLCLLLSILIEYLKNKLGFYILQQKTYNWSIDKLKYIKLK